MRNFNEFTESPYEDEGDNYNYERGAFSTIELTWNEKKKTCTIGERKGEFATLEKQRSIRIVIHDKEKEIAQTIRYSGKEIKCRF